MTLTKDVETTFKEYVADNGGVFYIAQEQNLSQALISISVKAGHFYDPRDCQGLAHLLEHMLFMGSRRLPANNQLIDLLKNVGGSINAWTAGEYANYHFCCNPEHINIALPAVFDALAHPLLCRDAIEKEIQAIDAEFAFKQKDDLRRLYQIHKETCNPLHPFSQFSVGNAAIYSQFSINQLQDKLRQFHSAHYFAENVRVVICLPSLTNDVVQVAHSAMKQLPQSSPTALKWPPLYLEEHLKLRIDIKPLQSARRLIVTFAIQADILPIRTALTYISHVLGDEGSNSLLAYLKKNSWASNLIAGSGIEGQGFKDFNVSIQLTELGELHVNDIVSAIFYTLNLIKKNNEQWRLQEKIVLDELAKKYSEAPPSLDNICDIAEASWSANISRLQDENTFNLKQAMAFFTTDNLRIKLISPSVITQKTCQFYHAEYNSYAISSKDIDDWNSERPFEEIALAPKNPYVVDSPLVLPRQTDLALPRLITQQDNYKVWFSQEQTFGSVKGDIYCAFDCPMFTTSVTQASIKRIWLHSTTSRLKHNYYRAGIAGQHYRLYGHQAGFTLHCSGFTQRLQSLTLDILDSIVSNEISEKSFLDAKNAQIARMQNGLLNKPINRLFSRLGVIVQRFSNSPSDMLKSLQQIEYGEFTAHSNEALNAMYCESFLHGNWSESNAQEWTSSLLSHEARFTAQPLSRDIIKLIPGESYIHSVDCEHKDAAIVLYLQAPSCSPTDTAYCMILEQLLAGPYFNALRTEQQLGYVVGSGYVPHNQHPGMAFYVQSPNYDCNQLLQAIIRFLREQIHEIGFYKSYWPNIQNNILKQLSEPDLTLSMQSQRYWLNLGLDDPACQRRKTLIECVQKMRFEDLLNCAQKLIERKSFGELILYTEGTHAALDQEVGTSIENIGLFKSNSSFFT